MQTFLCHLIVETNISQKKNNVIVLLFKTGALNVTTFSNEEDRGSSTTNINQGFNEQPAHAPGKHLGYNFYFKFIFLKKKNKNNKKYYFPNHKNIFFHRLECLLALITL